jgi:hypothetical protein
MRSLDRKVSEVNAAGQLHNGNPLPLCHRGKEVCDPSSMYNASRRGDPRKKRDSEIVRASSAEHDGHSAKLPSEEFGKDSKISASWHVPHSKQGAFEQSQTADPSLMRSDLAEYQAEAKEFVMHSDVMLFYRWLTCRNFFRTVVLHLLITALVGAAIVKAVSPPLNYLDCFFVSASATTSTGLATVSMADISLSGFVVLYVSMFLGNGIFLQILALLYRM